MARTRGRNAKQCSRDPENVTNLQCCLFVLVVDTCMHIRTCNDYKEILTRRVYML